jgi:hypothetical protein
MERIWIVSHERFRNDSESYDILAAFETEKEASTAMKQYGHNIRENEYNKIPYACITDSTMFRIKENDISFIVTQEDILRVIPVEIRKFDFNQNRILKYINNVK